MENLQPVRRVQRLCVFCGSSSGTRPLYAEAAAQLGRDLASSKTALVFGGGRVGVMGILADSVLSAGGQAIGVMPRALVEKEIAHTSLTELHVVESMHQRKALMADLADAFLLLPGGFGSWEEFFEVVTWLQLGIQQALRRAKRCRLLRHAPFFNVACAQGRISPFCTQRDVDRGGRSGASARPAGGRPNSFRNKMGGARRAMIGSPMAGGTQPRAGVGVLLVDELGRVLLTLRKLPPEADCWSILGGKLDFLEALEECAIREAHEEAGVEIVIERLLCVSDHRLPSEGQHWVSPAFLGRIVSGEARNCEPNKTQQVAWFPLDQLPPNLTMTARNAVQAYSRQSGIQAF